MGRWVRGGTSLASDCRAMSLTIDKYKKQVSEATAAIHQLYAEDDQT